MAASHRGAGAGATVAARGGAGFFPFAFEVEQGATQGQCGDIRLAAAAVRSGALIDATAASSCALAAGLGLHVCYMCVWAWPFKYIDIWKS